MTVLVTGATGRVGREVVGHLLKRGEKVRALTRKPESARLPDGVEVVAGDLSIPSSLAPALEGVTGLHLMTSANGEPVPDEVAAGIVAAAERAGVRHVTVLWSGVEGAVERALAESRLGWTVLEPVEFMSNALDWADSLRTEGVARLLGDRPGALVHESDMGEVAAVALVESLAGDGRHAAQRYVLTGPEALTPAERVRALSDALGRDLRFEELTEEQARDLVRATGASEEGVDHVVGWYLNPPVIAYTVSPAVERVTGHPALTFAQWAKEHADSFR
ncbi:NAD(P)H-binding protein [Streptomyces sp. NPDC059063]|uniref:NmrA family NAD(P)-binding protein n=1 Tax=unclassified Streptomyces TaxID=2593676 RepID=UPI0036933B25